MIRKQYRALNFDLNTAALQNNYPGVNFRQAYQDIRQFLEDNGFEHRQGSGYRSIKEMTDAEITLLAVRLGRELPWLAKCVKRFDVTNIGSSYDLCDLFISSDEMELAMYEDWLSLKSRSAKEKSHGRKLSRER